MPKEEINRVHYTLKEYKRKSNNLDFDYNNRKRDFEKETHTFLNSKKQIKYENKKIDFSEYLVDQWLYQDEKVTFHTDFLDVYVKVS